MDQELVNWLLGGFGALCGFFLKVMWQAVKDLQVADTKMTAKVNNIEVLVAGDYVSRIELDRIVNRLFIKLDLIDAKLSEKVDK